MKGWLLDFILTILLLRIIILTKLVFFIVLIIIILIILDIIIDSDFKAWLLEINSSPSLSRETMLDDDVKQKMIDDTISLLDPIDFDRKRTKYSQFWPCNDMHMPRQRATTLLKPGASNVNIA